MPKRPLLSFPLPPKSWFQLPVAALNFEETVNQFVNKYLANVYFLPSCHGSVRAELLKHEHKECGLRLQEEFGASLGEGVGVGVT